jgi:hypothetical protein
LWKISFSKLPAACLPLFPHSRFPRGLWEMEGDMMGGPFVSHARVDRANGRVIVVEAFIYSPDKLKRNLMRQMEASLYTLRLPNESLIDEIVISGNIPEEKIDTTSRVK